MGKSSVLGYPRIGENREWKKSLEAFWSGKLDETGLHRQLQDIRLKHLRLMRDKGIDLIPVNDFTYYDHMLDTAVMFGLIPERFGHTDSGAVPLSVYYGMARGTKTAAASEMTKWFNTNYHYIVPELDGALPVLTENKPLLAFREAKEQLGIIGKPVLVGPLTFLKLSKGCRPSEADAWLERLLPLYVQVLRELAAEGAEWVQLDEPILVTQLGDADLRRLKTIYDTFAKEVPGSLKIMLQTYFEAVEGYDEIVRLPVAGIGLDFAQGLNGSLSALKAHGFPEDKVLGAGLIDGRSIWRSPLREKQALLNEIAAFVSPERILVQSSCSLLHVPVTAGQETGLPPELTNALAFADEKLEELVLLARHPAGAGEEPALAGRDRALEAFRQASGRVRPDIRQAVMAIAEGPLARSRPFAERYALQQSRWRLPPLPTTTIGSFPQSAEVRKARQLWRKGEWSEAQYAAFIREQIDAWIGLQEDIGLDVLVHGEFERTDMVEFFGEKLAGFAFTRNGWVQSYGSRCVKPPIIYGDIAFTGEMTVEETRYAQSRTKRPVKGMLTGPVTILNWSFVRDDLPREQIAYQLAYALRQEVAALEQAGIGMIQVDEPAIREGLPLKAEEQAGYLAWAVKAFRLTTCTVRDTTQIHTHMCYCEFHDMIDSIEALDADVISIEASRSHGELIHTFEENTYGQAIGLGVYDIHSPRVPAVEEMTAMIDRALRVLDPKLFWINPDCGLKTRGQEETVRSLRHMVEATLLARAKRQELFA